MSLRIFEYTEKSIVVIGEKTKNYTEQLGALGSFNKWLKSRDEHDFKGGAGWIFSKKKLNSVTELVNKINSGELEPLRLS